MTGQVKEDILSRIGELGVFVKDGCIRFNPCLLRAGEFLKTKRTYRFININHESQPIDLQPNSLAFSYCQVPIIYKIAEQVGIEAVLNNAENKKFKSLTLSEDLSAEIFERSGKVNCLIVSLTTNLLK